VFHLGIAQAAIRSAGLDFSAIDRDEVADVDDGEWVNGARRSGTLRVLQQHATRVLA